MVMLRRRRASRYGSRFKTRRRLARRSVKRFKRRYGRRPFRRSTYRLRRGAKKAYVSSSATKELMVYQNPYSSKTQQPKIPDGSRNYSLGVSFRGQLSVTGKDILIMLTPTLTVQGWYSKDDGSTWAPIATNNPSGIKRDETNNLWKMEATADMEAWRMVSCGLKVKNINNYNANDGYWKAIRYRPCSDYGYVTAYPTPVFPGDIWGDWANDPSFSSGRVKDLHKKDFILAVENDEHKWSLMESSASADLKAEDLADFNHDIILIRLSGQAESHFILDSYYNYELTFRDSSTLNKFQTRGLQVLPKTLALVQQKKRRKCIRAAS